MCMHVCLESHVNFTRYWKSHLSIICENESAKSGERCIITEEKLIPIEVRLQSIGSHSCTHTKRCIPDSLQSHSQEWCHSRVVCVFAWTKTLLCCCEHSLTQLTCQKTSIKTFSNQNWIYDCIKSYFCLAKQLNEFYFLWIEQIPIVSRIVCFHDFLQSLFMTGSLIPFLLCYNMAYFN